MNRRTALLLVLSILSATPVAAQAASAVESRPGPSVAVLTISGTLPATPAGELGIALPLLERLGREPALRAVEAGAHNERTLVQTFTARFSFPTLEALTAWWRSPGARELLTAVEEALSRDSVRVVISMQRGFPFPPPSR